MDEASFHATRRTRDALPCVFDRAVLAGCADCELAVRHALAERETLVCASPVARTNCETLFALLRERSAFALRVPPAGARLTHAAAMRIACGGLAGVAASLDGPPADVHRLVQAAQRRHGSLADLPWPAVVASIAGWRGRRRHRADGAR